KLKFSTERISEQGLQIGVLKSENNSLKHADIESAKSIEELKNALAASSGQIANARQESKKNFDDLEKRVVSLVTKCNGKSIFVDTFSVIKDIWSKLNGIKTGENGLIIENDRDTNIFRIVTSEKIKAISRICAAFRLDKDAVDRDKFSEFGIIFNDRGISYNVFYIDISRKYSYYYNVNFNEITGRFVWSQMSQASLGDKNIIPNKIYNVKISYENNNIDFYIDDIKLLSTQIFAIGSGQMLGGAGLYFRATGAARVEVPAFGIFD
ncbi:MAG: hypothetical protein M9883_17105, partial [Methylobacteriaceae bacterium]|nr:hypothetical protein [Methylobacteriaceae bacterium]